MAASHAGSLDGPQGLVDRRAAQPGTGSVDDRSNHGLQPRQGRRGRAIYRSKLFRILCCFHSLNEAAVRLANKVTLITGAGSGIGRAAALLFSKEGAKVTVVDRDRKRGEETCSQIVADGGQAAFISGDVGRAVDVKGFIDGTVQHDGRLDVLFNNAGINPVGTVVDTAEEVWDNAISTNLKGVFLGCRFAIPHMIRQGGGSIINMASVNGLSGFYNEVAYDASKGGVVLLTKSTALDFGSKNIRVNCICPGITDTPMVHGLAGGRHIDEDYEGSMKVYSNYNAAFKRLITPEEIARAALFLASDESSGVTGAALVVDGGYTAI